MFNRFTAANHAGAAQQSAFSTCGTSSVNNSAAIIMGIACAVSIFVFALLGIIIGVVSVSVLLSLALILLVLVLAALIISTTEYRPKAMTP